MSKPYLASFLFEIIGEYAAKQGFDFSVLSVEDMVLERPKNPDFGDWATPISLKLAKRWALNPRDLAQALAESLSKKGPILSAEVAGPGFLNIRLTPESLGEVIHLALTNADAFGESSRYRGVSFNLEFVSANPTGPIHIGGTRWAAVGDSLARILEKSGATVDREYYFNDHGTQIDRFARSLQSSYLGLPAPEDGYGGEYISEIAQQIADVTGDNLSSLTEEEQLESFRSLGVDLMFTQIKASLADFGVHFDVYFHEDSLHEQGAVTAALTALTERGHIYEEGGALWLRTSSFGDDKDRVLIKSDGQPAYFAADVAYYLNKRTRGFDRNIIMLGADHHGYVSRMMAMCAAFGDTPGESLEILIGQMVNLVRDGEALRMSKRAGTVVTLEDLVEAVGVDAARYALVRSSIDSMIDLDLDLWSKKTSDNPVFYVQYAHARTCAVQRNASSLGIEPNLNLIDYKALTHEMDIRLLRVLQGFSEVVDTAAELREPHRVARYLEELAGAFHRWYDQCRVIPAAEEDYTSAHGARLLLNNATSQVLRNGLFLLGVSAPERM